MKSLRFWPRAFIALLLSIAVSEHATARAQAVTWTYHHEKAQLPGVQWKALGKAYLGKTKYRDLGTAPAPKKGSRLVIANYKSALGAGVLTKLGLSADGGLSISGQDIPADAGLIVLSADPDGDGQLALFTGSNNQAVYQTLTVPTNMQGSGWFVVQNRKVVAKGAWPPVSPASFSLDQALVLRLDLNFFRLRRRFGALSIDDQALVLARRLAGEGAYLEAALGPGVDLFQFYRRLLSESRRESIVAHWTAIRLDADQLVAQTEAQVDSLLGARTGPSPAIAFLVGDPDGTNAKTFGEDPITGRLRVLINVLAHRDETAIRISLAHELVHTRQTRFGPSLLDKAATEGIAALLSGRLVPNQSDAQLLMWPTSKLEAATKHQDAIYRAFLAASRDDQSDLNDWLIKDRPLRAVPGAPDRAAYWLGFLAARKWFAEHPNEGAKGLLNLTGAELFEDFAF